jgi:glycosyltransferase involved in cell wall biosynthesis
MQPLVSVIMPSFNARRTLRLAMASLAAQTYQNWECVLVDDGSIDDSAGLAERVDDSRIRIYRFEENKGRGAARQFALEHAKGKYLCMLDADDWIYPWKVAGQVEVLEAEREIALLSASMAIVDGQQCLAGVRGHSAPVSGMTVFEATRRPLLPAIFFAPSMIRIEVARRFGFDGRLRFGEDTDFLVSMLMSNRHARINRVGYTYAEYASATLDKVTAMLAVEQRVFAKYRPEFPVGSRTRMAAAACKSAAYKVSSALGLWTQVIKRRSRPPSPDEAMEFEAARAAVVAKADLMFPHPAHCDGVLR